MSISFPSTLSKPSGITASPSGTKRPAFGTLYGFDSSGGEGGGGAFTNQYSVDFDGTNDYLDTGTSFQSTFRSDFLLGLRMKRHRELKLTLELEVILPLEMMFLATLMVVLFICGLDITIHEQLRPSHTHATLIGIILF